MPIDIEDLETPVPVVDMDRLERNLARTAAYAKQHDLALRPHVKTHKAPYIAERQIQSGARGLTCATPREIEVMSGVSDDLLLAYPALGRTKLERLMNVARHARLTVALDSVEAAHQLGAAADEAGRNVAVYVELDLGMHRVGVQSAADAIAVIRAMAEHPALRYGGITFYAGHIRDRVSDQRTKLDRLNRDVDAAVAELTKAGLTPPVVSGGSTPTIWQTHEIAHLTEMRPGTYVYNDRGTSEIGACAEADCALTVLATVVSTAVPGQAVIDAGSKALGREPVRGVSGEGFGALLGDPGVIVASMSEEHGILDLAKTSWRPRVGERVRIVPNHVCIVVHLHEAIFGLRETVVETHWPVAARGRYEPGPALFAGR
jgi:D-serine deaminase-like pyridoxal phosphate-dependent protein